MCVKILCLLGEKWLVEKSLIESKKPILNTDCTEQKLKYLTQGLMVD